MDPAVTFLSILGGSMALRILGGWTDGLRVVASIRKRGGHVLEKSWKPHGSGLLEKKFSRLYRVVYRDEKGRTHLALITSSLFSGIQPVQDQITATAPANDSSAPAAP